MCLNVLLKPKTQNTPKWWKEWAEIRVCRACVLSTVEIL